jgi:putative intracellular protease/amidase
MNGIVVQYPGCIMDEVRATQELLGDSFDLRVVELSQISNHLEADFIVIPGGSCGDAVVHPGLLALLKKVDGKGGLLAGICNGALVLASAGVLKGRRCTHTARPKYAPLPQFRELLEIASKLFADSIYVDEDVVVSANVITAKPSASRQFAVAVQDFLNSQST